LAEASGKADNFVSWRWLVPARAGSTIGVMTAVDPNRR
jgi:hypothetical protein